MRFLSFGLAFLFSTGVLSANEREYEPVPQTLERTQKSAPDGELQLQANVYNVWYSETIEQRTHPVYDCDTDVGDGADGNWHNYWNARKEDKPSALADSIKGIGYASAKKIVDSHRYFVKKPRSWNQFSNEIREISQDRELGLSDVYYNAVVQYGRENAQNLGYASSTNCQWKDVTENVVVPVKHRDFIKSVRAPVNIRFEGGLLLSREKETFQALYDGLEVKVSATSAVNEYQVLNHDDRELIIRAIRRIPVRPDTATLGVSVFKEGDTIKLKINDALSEELKKLYAQSALQVTYKVTRSAVIDNDEAEGSILMDGSETTVDLKTNPTWEKELFGNRKKTFVRGKKYYVKIQIQRLNTDTFNRESSERIKSSGIVY